MDVVDQKFRISYVLLLNSIAVKNLKFQVYLHQKKNYITRKLIAHFKLLLFEICKNSSERAGRLELV